MFRRFFLYSLLFLTFAAPAFAQEEEAMPTETAAPASASSVPENGVIDTIATEAYMIDYDTGAVLFEKNPDARMPTSSMSKTLTAYVVFKALRDGRVTPDTTFKVSENAWKMQGSKMFVELGKDIKVSDLLQGVIVQSGNDATIVLAEGLAGSEIAFAAELNKTAQELGMNNSHFANASGWPDPDHYSTARDLAALARALIRDFPEEYKLFAEKEFTYNNIKQGNRNPLLYRNIGADGVKTGHTEDAGYGLMASATAAGRRVILVINGLPDMQARADESAKLIDWGLRAFDTKTLFRAGAGVDSVPVLMGQQNFVPLIVESDVKVTLPRMAANDVKAVAKYDAPLKAPVKKGAELGTLEVSVPGQPAQSYKLVAGADVTELGFFKKALAHIKYTFSGGKLPAATAQTAAVETTPAPVEPAIVEPAPAPAPAPQPGLAPSAPAEEVAPAIETPVQAAQPETAPTEAETPAAAPAEQPQSAPTE